ncbi:hypothetical protein ETD83_39660 [Actinomadura soli]|uniref:Uncharacterized protein n=1 Tax=Actinomadura soli TaxID=2508997 RepID=A0A5C4IZ38_9ACTN|nr:hypothetical protein ETD83_39660 [Actinomadura soli]
MSSAFTMLGLPYGVGASVRRRLGTAVGTLELGISIKIAAVPQPGVLGTLAIDDATEDHQRECEKVAVAALARSHRGFCEGASIAHRETLLRL